MAPEAAREATAVQSAGAALTFGAESAVINGILRVNAPRICYVSCDPATLARDLKKLVAGGYMVQSLAAFDLFPQTHHVETVVHLQLVLF